MKSLKQIALLSFLVLLTSTVLNAQAALQEIVRFNCPWGNCFSHIVQGNGDINGDGCPDLIFTCFNPNDIHPENGRIYIYYSIPNSNMIPDQILTAIQQNHGGFGGSLAYGGDLNGDSIDDLVVSSVDYGEVQSGAVSIYYGGNTISEQPDVMLYGEDYPGDTWALFFGSNLLTDCDLNGDGINDLVVYGSGPSGIHTGSVYVFLGGQQFSTNCALYLAGTSLYEYLGQGLATGDINGDGFDDIVLTRKVQSQEQTYPNEIIDIYAGGHTLSSSPVYEKILVNDHSSGISGNILANGDLNGDGFDDILFMYYTLTDAIVKVIYGGSDFSSLSVQDYPLPLRIGLSMQYYCNLNNDLFTDFCAQQDALALGSPEIGYFTVFTQNSNTLDLNYDFMNCGTHAHNQYGFGYYLGDMNLDGHPEFFVISREGSFDSDYINYATILTESYVGNSDEIQPIPASPIRCFPNPFRDQVNIKIMNKQQYTSYDIGVFDIRGRRVFNQKNIKSDSYIWDVKGNKDLHLSHGIYLLKITGNDNKIYTSKLVYSE